MRLPLSLPVSSTGEPRPRFRGVSVGIALAAVARMTNRDQSTIDLGELARVCGGMKWEDFRRSPNIEDRRDGGNPVSPPMPALPQLVRRPNDLSQQAGLDNLGGPWALP